MTRVLWLCTLLGVGACVTGAELQPLPQAPAAALEAFASGVQPVLAARCANPSCHGTPERPLSLYAVQRYRWQPDDTFLDAPLSERELSHNLVQLRLFVQGAREPSQTLLLLKPLAARAGGEGHAGVEVFADRTEYDYQRLYAFAEAALEEGLP